MFAKFCIITFSLENAKYVNARILLLHPKVVLEGKRYLDCWCAQNFEMIKPLVQLINVCIN